MNRAASLIRYHHEPGIPGMRGEPRPSATGSPCPRTPCKADVQRVLGLDIGGTKCAVIEADWTPSLSSPAEGTLTLRRRLEMPTQSARGQEQTQRRLFACLHEFVEDNRQAGCEPLGIGVSCGGPLDSRKGLVLSPPHLPGWDAIPIVHLLEERFGIPAFLQNDANACALAEWKLGAGRGTDSMVFFTMGTGFGAGLVMDGHLLSGRVGMAGEIGHVRMTPEGPEAYGKAGSVEAYCSGAGIGALARTYTAACMAKGQPPAWIRDGHSLAEVDVRLLSSYAKRENPEALLLFREAGSNLGRACAMVMDFLNPERIVIGSIFVRCEQWLRPAMEKTMEEEALPITREGCTVVPAGLGERIGDLASVLTVCHGLGLSPVAFAEGPHWRIEMRM